MKNYQFKNHDNSESNILKDHVLSTVAVWQHVRQISAAAAMAAFEHQAAMPTGRHDVVEVGWRMLPETEKQSLRQYLQQHSTAIYQQIAQMA